MSLFSVSGKSKRNFRRKVVHSISDSDTEEQSTPKSGSEECSTVISEKKVLQIPAERKVPDTDRILSFLDEDGEGDEADEFKLKKPDHSRQQLKKKRTYPSKEKPENITLAETMIDEDLRMLSQVGGGVIPNAAMIHAARKRRELARSCGAASGVDFMSLKQTSNTSQKCDQVGDHDDDDDDDNSDEGASKVRQFGIRPDATKQMLVLSAMDNAESGSDEEKFEKQQINKGTYSFPVPAPSDCSQCVGPVQYEETIPMPPLQGAPVSTEAEPEFMLTPISVESLQSQLQSQLSHVQDQRSLNNASITKLREDLAAAHNEIETMESHTLTLAMRYEFYQEMRGYIKDLLLCLTEKEPKIKDLEDHFLNVLKKKSKLLIERRRQDILDAVDECAGKPDAARHGRIVEREGRRRRRREVRSRVVADVGQHNDGDSSDDELLESTRLKFQSEIDDIVGQRTGMFADVLDDFSIVSQVIKRFHEWKYNFTESYDQAYISLCLPKLLVPYVRLHLIMWKPFAVSPVDVMECSTWMESLLFFVEQYKCDDDEFDSDVNIIPKVIELTVLPKLNDILEASWDPLSSSQTDNIKNVILYLIENFPSLSLTCHSFQRMSKVIVKRINETLQNDIFVPMLPQEVMLDTSSLQYKFSQRQFWTSFKLLKNLLIFHGLLAEDLLVELVVDGLLNRYILLSLQNTPVTAASVSKLGMIFSLLPWSWWRAGTLNGHHFSGMLRYIVNLIEILQKSLLTEPECNRQDLRDSIRQAKVLLSKASQGPTEESKPGSY